MSPRLPTRVLTISTATTSEFAIVPKDWPAITNNTANDDNAESIQLTDQHGNEILLSQDGITLKTDGNVLVDAGGDVEISGSTIDLK